MAVPVKKKVVAKKATEEKKEVKKVVAKAPVKAEKKAVKAEPKKAVNAEPKKAEKTEAKKGGLFAQKKTPDSAPALVEGKQATQEQFITILQKKLIDAFGNNNISKKEAVAIQKAYSETLKEVTDKCSFQDTTAGIFYARREIDSRVTNPPKAEDGLQTLMLKHYELKVRKVLADEDEIKFSGTLSDDGETFITKEGKKIKLSASAPTPKKAKPVKDEEEEVEDEEEEVADDSDEEEDEYFEDDEDSDEDDDEEEDDE